MGNLSKVFLSGLVVALFVLLISGVALKSVSAQTKTPNPHSQGATRSADARHKLDAVKLKVCLGKQDILTKRSQQLIKNAVNMQEKFDVIAIRVQDYYTLNVVPSGKTVSDYDHLIELIHEKKSLVSTALTKVQGDLGVFSCDGDDPKGQMGMFGDSMKDVKKSLKEYRTSIKDLIVAVHGVTGDENKNSGDKSASKSGKPTKEPKTGGQNP